MKRNLAERRSTLLDQDQCTGLQTKWWTYWNEFHEIDSILDKAFLIHWKKSVDEVLRKNVGSSRPSSWRQLSHSIRRHEKRIQQIKKTIPSSQQRFDIATALGVEDCDLSPTLRLTLTSATVLLCCNYSPKEIITTEHADSYAKYALHGSSSNSNVLDSDIIYSITRGKSPDEKQVVTSVLSVSKVVGTIIINHFPSMLTRMEDSQ